MQTMASEKSFRKCIEKDSEIGRTIDVSVKILL